MDDLWNTSINLESSCFRPDTLLDLDSFDFVSHFAENLFILKNWVVLAELYSQLENMLILRRGILWDHVEGVVVLFFLILRRQLLSFHFIWICVLVWHLLLDGRVVFFIIILLLFHYLFHLMAVLVVTFVPLHLLFLISWSWILLLRLLLKLLVLVPLTLWVVIPIIGEDFLFVCLWTVTMSLMIFGFSGWPPLIVVITAIFLLIPFQWWTTIRMWPWSRTRSILLILVPISSLFLGSDVYLKINNNVISKRHFIYWYC